MVILENIDIDIDIDKAILQNIDIDKISNRFKFGISNRASRNSIIEFVDVFVSHVGWWLQLAGGCQYDWETTATFPMNVSHTGIPKPATNYQQAKSHAQPDQEKHI